MFEQLIRAKPSGGFTLFENQSTTSRWPGAVWARAVAGKNMLVLSTIRLETIRDGLEDHEYFALLEKAIKKAKAEKPSATLLNTIARAEKLLDAFPHVASSLTQWTHHDRLMRQHRGEVARAIESLSSK